MKKTKIIEIGPKAISETDPMLILFDDTATDEVKKVALVQELIEEEPNYKITTNSHIHFDDQVYQVEHVGDKVNQMLQEIGHATIIFAERHEDHDLPNTIYVSPYQLPALSVGTEIIYR